MVLSVTLTAQSNLNSHSKMKDFAITSLALIITGIIMVVAFPIALKLLFAVGPLAFALIVIGVLSAMAMS